ncbi:uncharacterized protein LOC131015604 [Salvia miltiorrhiza]|uniref:uncharacterized protein LOC131015604 n=1 Tax=Salvia miltiorrhiza TaxID=226208 RepID=UPI0025ABF31B|nr:uncharacterized protein LOC131015604 [Salvia miltiorrhiza]
MASWGFPEMAQMFHLLNRQAPSAGPAGHNEYPKLELQGVGPSLCDSYSVSDDNGNWRLTGFYGFPDRSCRRDSWNLLRRLAGVNSLPWVVIGDFNDLLDPGDKRGHAPHPNWLFTGFREGMIDSGIMDIALAGYQFTWSRGLGSQNFVEERLDRAMANDSWKALFPQVVLSPVTAPISDHVHLLLKCVAPTANLIRRRFRFENKWRIKRRLEATITELCGKVDPASIDKLRKTKKDLASILAREEEHWKQRAKQFWLKDGDQNTKFFHSMASARRKVNPISRLQRNDGSWATTLEDLRITAKEYDVLSRIRPCIDESKNKDLTRPFVVKEFTDALSQMHPDKSPGPDGFNPKFYQRFWGVLGKDIFQSCCDWLNAGAFPPQLNRTIISLIPKVLCNRLKSSLPFLIDRAQSTFVEGRLIHDNILIAFETIHTMKKKVRGRYGTVALKIDISKAYDRVCWDYLEAVLEKLGFCSKWRGWMSMCIRTRVVQIQSRSAGSKFCKVQIRKIGSGSADLDRVSDPLPSLVSYDVLVNGSLVGPIMPGRGLRQGDPLSPYLFILCAEGLSAIINYEMARGNLHGIQINRGGPTISHLMFADDCVFFCRASVLECTNLKRLLGDYERASGQGINYHKSGIMFSSNVLPDDRDSLSQLLGVWSPLNTGRYLGLHSLIGRNKKEIFQYLRERLWNKVQGWSGKKLSKAGKEVLIKAVAQAIPSFCMAIFAIPTGLTDDMERMLNKFWWSNKAGGGRGINWMSWHELCVDKQIGGMGFRSFQIFNAVMLGKTGWRLLHDPDALVSRVLRAKYYPNGNFLTAKLGYNPSFTWRSIHSAQDLVKRGVRWRIGSRTGVRVFKDPWLRRDHNFRVSVPPPQGLEDMRVADLINEVTGSWIIEDIKQLLPEKDVAAIVSILIFPESGVDVPIGHYSASGCYTVKSAYSLASSLTLDPSYGEEGPWAKIWKLSVPPKVRSLMWRAAKANLPSKAELMSRGLQVGGECGVYKVGFENLWHVFFACPFAERCCEDGGFSILLASMRVNCDSFKNAIFHIMKLTDGVQVAKVCMIMWHIWKDRNKAVWEGTIPVPSRTVALAISCQDEWLEARATSSSLGSLALLLRPIFPVLVGTLFRWDG